MTAALIPCARSTARKAGRSGMPDPAPGIDILGTHTHTTTTHVFPSLRAIACWGCIYPRHDHAHMPVRLLVEGAVCLAAVRLAVCDVKQLRGLDSPRLVFVISNKQTCLL